MGRRGRGPLENPPRWRLEVASGHPASSPPLAGGGRGDTQHPVPPPRCHPGGAERPHRRTVPDPGGKMGVVAVNYLPGGELITVCAPLFKGLVIN